MLSSNFKGFHSNEILISALDPVPIRFLPSDDPYEILRFATAAFVEGGVALATLTEIRGGAARTLGSHVVVAADGRFCGYVSGGCVEAAVAAEALLAIAEERDRTVKFGAGSAFFDIVLPCGGGITVAIHVLRDVAPIHEVLERLERRQPAGLQYDAERQLLRAVALQPRASFFNGDFSSIYYPRTRIIVSGNTIEAQAVATIAKSSGYDVVIHTPDPDQEKKDIADAIDASTAVVLMHHDLDAEKRVLEAALHSPAFYIGALGSTRTHACRTDRLRQAEWLNADINRIKAPIGIFGPARDSSSLALSVLADIAACRLIAHRCDVR